MARELVPRLQLDTDGMLGSLSSAEIEELLGTEVVARLGCHAEGRTYVVPVTYAYNGDALLIQSADGLKLRMMHVNPGEFLGADASAVLARLRERETRVRSGNGHASIYRIHLFEKTGRFERR